MKRRSVIRCVVSLLLLLAASEGAIRASGLVDFPIYHVDPEIGYIPAPTQEGSFLRTHAWVFNDRSMGTASAWNPSTRPNILLIGNSVVMGGNPYDQKNKLGPLVQQGLEGYSVWPIAAGGWTNVNETVYIERNPEIARSAHFFVWEYMSGGLSGLSHWRGEYVFPREHPAWAGWYVFRRYVWPRLYHTNMSELPPTGAIDSENLKRFEAALTDLRRATGRNSPGLLFLYPKKAEYQLAMRGQEWLPERAAVERVAQAHGLKVVDIAREPEWNEGLYRDDGAHPTVQGNIVLAKIVTAAIRNALLH